MSDLMTSSDAPGPGVDVASILDGYEDSTSVSAGLTGYEKLAAEPKAETKTDEGETFQTDFDELVRTQAAVHEQAGFEDLVQAAGDVLLGHYADEAATYLSNVDLEDRHSAELALEVLTQGVQQFGEVGLEVGVQQLVQGLGYSSLSELAEEDEEGFQAVIEIIDGVGESLEARHNIAIELRAEALEAEMDRVQSQMIEAKALSALERLKVPQAEIPTKLEGLIATAALAGIDLGRVEDPEELEQVLLHCEDIANAAQRKLDEAPIRSILTRSMGRGVADVQRELSGDYLPPYTPTITDADVKAERLAREEREQRENVSNIDIKAALSGAGRLRLADGFSGRWPTRKSS